MRKRDQHVAYEQMRNLAAPAGYRVARDAEGFPVIPARLGRIEWHDPEGRQLAVYTDRPRLFARLLAMPGLKRHQRGDHEVRALFPVETLPRVARLIKARRRRSQSAPKSLQNLRPRAVSPG
jgi:hypothetical protein